MLESIFDLARASSYADRIDWLFTLITVVVGFWLIMAEGVLLYFLFLLDLEFIY